MYQMIKTTICAKYGGFIPIVLPRVNSKVHMVHTKMNISLTYVNLVVLVRKSFVFARLSCFMQDFEC